MKVITRSSRIEWQAFLDGGNGKIFQFITNVSVTRVQFLGDRNQINQDILYDSKSEGGLNFIDYHWAVINDKELDIKKSTRAQNLNWGPEADVKLSCVFYVSQNQSHDMNDQLYVK